MAIVKFINSKASLKKSLDYITKECKTNDNLITAINCNKESAYDEMMFTKREFNKILKEAFDKSGIEIPYNQIDVHIKER